MEKEKKIKNISVFFISIILFLVLISGIVFGNLIESKEKLNQEKKTNIVEENPKNFNCLIKKVEEVESGKIFICDTRGEIKGINEIKIFAGKKRFKKEIKKETLIGKKINLTVEWINKYQFNLKNIFFNIKIEEKIEEKVEKIYKVIKTKEREKKKEEKFFEVEQIMKMLLKIK